MKIEEYDQERLLHAEKLINKVYEYYYAVPTFRKHVKRLETILKKLNEVRELDA